jgi:hypothetical protein
MVDDGRERLIFNFNAFGRVDGFMDGGGHDYGDRLTHIADLVMCERRRLNRPLDQGRWILDRHWPV